MVPNLQKWLKYFLAKKHCLLRQYTKNERKESIHGWTKNNHHALFERYHMLTALVYWFCWLVQTHNQ